MTVLDDILVGVRADLAERQALLPLDDLKAARRRTPARASTGSRRCAATTGSGSSPRSSARSPSQGRARRASPTRPRSPRDYEAGGAAVHQRAHRAAPVRRLARRPRRGARRGRHPGAAQGLHRQPATSCGRPARTAPTSCCSSWPRSSSTRWCRLRRARRVARADAARRGARRGRGRRAPLDAGARVIGVNARNLHDPRGRPRPPSRGSRRSSPTPCVKVAESGVRGPHDLHRRTPAPAPTPCWSGRAW